MDRENHAGFHAQNALIVSGSEKGAAYLAELLRDHAAEITRTASAAEAAHRMAEAPFDLILVNAPLADETGDRFAAACAESTCAGVLLLIKEENFEKLSPEAENAGVLILTKPAGKNALLSAISLAAAVARRLFAARSKADTLEAKMDEMKLVNRAKWLLIGKLGMSEADAHRYIEKLAMDMRRPRREVAEGIIKTYET